MYMFGVMVTLTVAATVSATTQQLYNRQPYEDEKSFVYPAPPEDDPRPPPAVRDQQPLTMGGGKVGSRTDTVPTADIYQGEYPGRCGRDGLYYRDRTSFVICSNGNSYVQPCAPGTLNSAPGPHPRRRRFCDVNLVDVGYAAEYYTDAGIHIFCVGVGLALQDEVLAVASQPGADNTILVDSFEQLEQNQVASTLVAAICQDADLCRNNPCKNDGKCVDGFNNFRCDCAEGFSGTTCERDCNFEMDLVFIVDASTSVGEDNFRLILGFVASVVRDLEFVSGKTRVGLIVFNDRAEEVFSLQAYRDRDDILHAIENVSYTSGGTYTADALRLVRESLFDAERGDRPSAPNKVVLVTDGPSNILPQLTRPEARRARSSGIHVYGIGVGLRDTSELESVCHGPTSVFTVARAADLAEAVRGAVLDAVCAHDTGGGGGGGEGILPSGGYQQDAATRYGASGGCPGPADLVFLLDSSGSVGRGSFNKVLMFVDQVVRLVALGGDKTRVAVLTYSSDARIHVSLKDAHTQSTLTSVLMSVPYTPGPANAAAALRRAREDVFVAAAGDRPGVPNVAVLVTDGLSDPLATVPMAELARSRGILLHTVGVGLPYEEEIRLIAGRDDRVFTTEGFDSLLKVAAPLKDAICTSIAETVLLDTTDQCASDPCLHDGLCIDGDDKYTCQCIPGYRGVNCEIPPNAEASAPGRRPACDTPADVAVLLDASASLAPADFRAALNFVDGLVRHVGTGEATGEGIRWALVTYSSYPEIEVYLSDYPGDVLGFSHHVLSTRQQAGHTNAADALRAVRQQVFKQLKGDRPDAKNLILLLTDGASNVNRGLAPIEAALAHQASDARILGVGVRLSRAGLAELKAVVGDDGQMWTVGDFAELETVAVVVSKALCGG